MKRYLFLVLSALLTTLSLSAQDATTGLKLHYTFDDGTAKDETVNKLDGSLVGSVLSVKGKAGKAISMASTADYVKLPNDITAGITDYTVTAWVNVKNLNTWGRIFDFGINTSTYMFLTPHNGGGVRYAIKLNDTDGEQFINGPKMTTGTWAHYAITCAFDPQTGLGAGKLYIDGVLVGTNDAMTITPAALGSTTQNYIGKSQWNDPTIGGSVDDFRVYSRALSPEDIMAARGLDKISTIDTILIEDAVWEVPFSSEKTDYNVRLAVGSTTVDPEVLVSAPGATVTGDGVVDVSSGTGVSTIVVTSIDGTSTNTYTLHYTVLEQSNDTKLSDLVISEGVLEPAFSPKTYNYVVNLPISATNISVFPTANDVLSTIAGDGVITLDQDGGEARIIVTAEDGSKQLYTINFIKGDVTNLIQNPSFEINGIEGWTYEGMPSAPWRGTTGDGDNTSDGKNTVGIWSNDISEIEFYQTINGLESGYYQVTALYTVSRNRLSNQRLFAGNKSQLFGKPTEKAYSAANLAILGATEVYTFAGYDLSTAENGPFRKLSVVEHVTDGTLRIGIKLSGKASALGYDYSYTTQGDLGFSKWDNFKLYNIGKKASLESITVPEGTFDVPFSSGTYSYNVSLAKGTTSIDPEIKLSYDGTPVTGDGAVDVSSGSGTSTIVVTSLDGTANRTYTIHYTVRTISNDARLSALTLSTGKMVPAFDQNVFNYKVVVPQQTPSITVSATAKDNKSTFTGTGIIPLVNSNGLDSIVVTAEDGTILKYHLKFERDNATFFKVTTAPTIDGIISAEEPYSNDQWDEQTATIGKNTKGSSSKFQIVHDGVNIYFAAQIVDSTVHAESTMSNTWERDCIELYFCMNPALTSYAEGVSNFRIQRDGAEISGRYNSTNFGTISEINAKGIQIAAVSNALGYVVEGKFPIDSLKGTAAFDGVNFTFEAKTADNVTGAAGGRTYQMAWKDNSDSQWQSPSYFTTAVLSPNAAPVVAIKQVSNNVASVYLDKTTKTLYISTNERQVQIYDLRGSLVSAVAMNGKNAVDVSYLQRGVYIVKCGKNVSKIVM